MRASRHPRRRRLDCVWLSHSSRKIAAEHRAEHEQVAVGEVDQLDDAVHHRVAQGDQRVQRAIRQPDRQHLGERRRDSGVKACTRDRDADAENDRSPCMSVTRETAPVHDQRQALVDKAE